MGNGCSGCCEPCGDFHCGCSSPARSPSPQPQQQQQPPPNSAPAPPPSYNTQNPSLQDAHSHIRYLERLCSEQQQEIEYWKKKSRVLDEKLYEWERGVNPKQQQNGQNGSNNNNTTTRTTSTDFQLTRYKEYILKAKEVIQQQKDRIIDLETTTMVGRLEMHLLEYKEYAARQKSKLEEMSREYEAQDRETRELREETDELRTRYHVLKRTNKQYQEELSPRRTPEYTQQLRVQQQQQMRGGRNGTNASFNFGASLSLPGTMGGSGGGYNNNNYNTQQPYSHANTMSEWERDLLAPPKTPTRDRFSPAGGGGGERGRNDHAYDRLHDSPVVDRSLLNDKYGGAGSNASPMSPSYYDDRYERPHTGNGVRDSEEARRVERERERDRERERERDLAERDRLDRDRLDRERDVDRDLRAAEARRDAARREETRLADVRREEQRKEDTRREKEREWERDYLRKYQRAPPMGANPYSLANTTPPVASRHRNSVARTIPSGSRYYNRYGRYETERDRAAMKIQSAWRGYLWRKRHPEEKKSRSHRSSSSSTGGRSRKPFSRSDYASASSASKRTPSYTNRHYPAGHALSNKPKSTSSQLTPLRGEYEFEMEEEKKPYKSSSASTSSYTNREREKEKERERERERERPTSSTSKHHTSSSSSSSKHRSSSSRKLTRDEAASRIQTGWRHHVKEKERKSSSRSKHHTSTNHRPSSSNHGTSSKHHYSSSKDKDYYERKENNNNNITVSRDSGGFTSKPYTSSDRDRDRDGYSSTKSYKR